MSDTAQTYYQNAQDMMAQKGQQAKEAEQIAKQVEQIASAQRPKVRLQPTERKRRAKRTVTPPPAPSRRETPALEQQPHQPAQQVWLEGERLYGQKHNLPHTEWKNWVPKLMALPQITAQELLDSIKTPSITLALMDKLEKNVMQFFRPGVGRDAIEDYVAFRRQRGRHPQHYPRSVAWHLRG